MNTITANDDVVIPVTIRVNGVLLDFHEASQVKAALTNRKRTIGPVSQTNDGGSDWTNGFMYARFTASDTATIQNEAYALAIEVILASETTTYWYSNAVIGKTDPIPPPAQP